MANVIQKVQKPTLVIAHNKTLAAQLCNEFSEFFPDNAVEYFVSYYDYYQPEAYIPRTDTYIEKDSYINEEIDRLRHAATTRSSCAGTSSSSPASAASTAWARPRSTREDRAAAGGPDRRPRRDAARLVDIQYERNDIELRARQVPGARRFLEISPPPRTSPSASSSSATRWSGSSSFDPLTGEVMDKPEHIAIYPATHFVTNDPAIERPSSRSAASWRSAAMFAEHGKILEAQRLRQRTQYDMEMLREMGYCTGIENYSRLLLGTEPGATPNCLLDYFPDDLLLLRRRVAHDAAAGPGHVRRRQARKENLVEYGFRLPSALDNRPLRFDEFSRSAADHLRQRHPGRLRAGHSVDIVEQVIRPTGLLDPEVEVRPTKGQIDDLMDEIRRRVDKGQRVLVTTLTKRWPRTSPTTSSRTGIKVRYLHSEVETLERIEILRDLRLGEFDVLVGINLLREGLDLPEVSLVAILDADKEGFLRAKRPSSRRSAAPPATSTARSSCTPTR